jgi:hypothetical protein
MCGRGDTDPIFFPLSIKLSFCFVWWLFSVVWFVTGRPITFPFLAMLCALFSGTFLVDLCLTSCLL